MHKRSDSSSLCKRCRKINLNHLPRRSHLTKVGEKVPRWQASIDRANLDSCPLCQLIMKAFHLSREEMIQNKEVLRSFSSRRIIGQGWASVDATLLSLSQPYYCGLPYIVYQPQGREIVRLLGPRIDFNIIKYWLRYCKGQHVKTCTSVRNKAELNSISSLKLIDCETNTIVPANGMPYVALSYLWGGGANNVASFVTSLPSDMPKTIKDAMTATRVLGFRYLWVDRYCINQTCQEEVAEQVHKMDLIYNHAELTIIAAAGQNANHGLPGVSPRQVSQPSARIGRHFLVSSMGDPRLVIEQSAWNRRGWTYQEGLLSRRRVVFTPDQVYFECCGMYCFEALNFPLPALHVQDSSRFKASFCDGVNLGMFPRQLGRTEWEVMQRITQYSAKSLSDPSDILNGVSGVLRALKQSPHKIRHCKGVPFLPRPPKPSGIEQKRAQEVYDAYKWSPTVGFCAGLCWIVTKTLKRRNGFPSWSWTGWNGEIDSAFTESKWRQLKSTLDIQFKVQLECGEECGLDEYFHKCINHDVPISDTLLVSGWVTPVQLTGSLLSSSYSQLHGFTETTADAVSLTKNGKPLDWDFTVTDEDLDVQTLGACLAIELAREATLFQNRFLMVVTETERGSYRRIGFAKRTGAGQFRVPEFAKTRMDLRLE